MSNIRAWVGHLGSYNAGYLIGKWIDLPKDNDEMTEVYDELMKEAASVGEYGDEFEIMDTDIESDALRPNLSRLGLREMNKIAEAIDGFSEWKLEEFEILVEACDSIDEALQHLEDCDYTTLRDIEDEDDLGRAWVEELGGLEVPPHLVNYLDYESIGRDLIHDNWTLVRSKSAAVCF